ncbi:fec operon regulator FecR [compost metagenome]
MKVPHTLQKLIKNYLLGFENKAEYETLKKWFEEAETNNMPSDSDMRAGQIRVFQRLNSNQLFNESPTFSQKFRYSIRVAASITIALGFAMGYYYYQYAIFDKISPKQLATIRPVQENVQLTFEDGEVVILNKQGQATRAIEGVQEVKNGELVYNDNADHIVQNILSTPRGQLFKIVLPDGTKVWMNANSSLSYPSKFAGAERLVELHGEAYFEVTKNPKQPFIVKTTEQQIKVLGTHFNINAYDNDRTVQTTLVEGKVEVQHQQQKMVLIPNQQAISKGSTLSKKNVDATEYITWRDGYFTFHNATPNEIMQQLARWYDLNVRLDNSEINERFSGKINKQMNLQEILTVLQTAGLNFDIVQNKNQQKTILLKN